MTQLPHSQIIKKREYVVLKRTDDTALVKVVNPDTQSVYGYEVHKLARWDDGEAFGRRIEAGEGLQSDAMFGKKAWYYGPAANTNAYSMALTKYKNL